MSATQCTRLLMDEHKTILRALTILDVMVKEAENDEQPSKADVRTIVDFLKSFADDLHQGKEESILFPIFSCACSRTQLDSVSHLIFEHNQERSLIEGLQDALLTNSRADFIYFAKRLIESLENHIYKEDNILFEHIAQTLSPADDAKAVAAFQEMDRAINVTANEALLGRLGGLERKYLGKAAKAG